MLCQTFVVWDIVIQKISNLFKKVREQPSGFQARDWVKVNDGRQQDFDSDLIEIKTSMLQSRLFYYISAYILVKGRVAAVVME